MLKYLTINTVSEFICFMVALFTLIKVKEFHWKGMIFLTLIICVTEFAGIYVEFSIPGQITQNAWLYNILLLFQAGFISFMFYHLLKLYMQILPVIIAEFVLLSGLYIYETCDHSMLSYHQLTNTVMLVIIILYSLLYYYFLITDNRYVNLVHHADFWWVTGILFFYFGTTACNIFYHHLAPNASSYIKHLTYHIYNAFNVVLYGCWSYSFICKRWETKTLPG